MAGPSLDLKARGVPLLRSVVRVLTSSVLVMVLGLAATVLLARLLGPEGVGLVAIAMLVPNMLVSLAELGVRQAVVYLVGKFPDRRENVIRNVVGLFLSTSVVFVLLAWLLSASLFPQLDRTLLLLAISTLPARVAVKFCYGVFLGRQEIGWFAVVRTLPNVFRLAGIVLFVAALDLGVAGALLALATAWTVVGVLAVRVVWRTTSLRPRFDPDTQRQLLTLGATYAVSTFLLMLNYRVDLWLLESLATVGEVGLYTQAVQLGETVWHAQRAVGIVIFSASAGALDAAAFSARVARVSRATVTVTACAAACLFVVAPLAVVVLFGSDFAEAGSMIRWLLPGIVLITAFKVINGDLLGAGRPLFAVGPALVALCANGVLNVLLIPRFGGNGAAMASSVSYALMAFLLAYKYARDVGVPVASLFFMTPGEVATAWTRLVVRARRLRYRSRSSRVEAANETEDEGG